MEMAKDQAMNEDVVTMEDVNEESSDEMLLISRFAKKRRLIMSDSESETATPNEEAPEAKLEIAHEKQPTVEEQTASEVEQAQTAKERISSEKVANAEPAPVEEQPETTFGAEKEPDLTEQEMDEYQTAPDKEFPETSSMEKSAKTAPEEAAPVELSESTDDEEADNEEFDESNAIFAALKRGDVVLLAEEIPDNNDSPQGLDPKKELEEKTVEMDRNLAEEEIASYFERGRSYTGGEAVDI